MRLSLDIFSHTVIYCLVAIVLLCKPWITWILACINHNLFFVLPTEIALIDIKTLMNCSCVFAQDTGIVLHHIQDQKK